MKALRVIIEGRVQGVGFRAWVEREAVKRRLQGYVRNRRDGSVEAVFQGEESAVDDMLIACNRGPRLSAVERLTSEPVVGESFSGFQVRATT